MEGSIFQNKKKHYDMWHGFDQLFTVVILILSIIFNISNIKRFNTRHLDSSPPPPVKKPEYFLGKVHKMRDSKFYKNEEDFKSVREGCKCESRAEL